MKRILKWGGILFVALIVIGVVASGGNKNSNPSSTNGNETSNSTAPATKETLIIVDATTLVKDYDNNKLAAQDKYTGKLVQTTAVIKNISSDVTGSYFLSLNPTADQYYFGTSIGCYFADGLQRSQLTALSNGQSVTVQGKMSDMSIGIVVMKECSIVK